MFQGLPSLNSPIPLLPSGKKYVGEWKDGRKDGQGTDTFVDGSKGLENSEKVDLGTSLTEIKTETS